MAVLRTVFIYLYAQRMMLEGMVLKPSMVLPGLACPHQATVDEVAGATGICAPLNSNNPSDFAVTNSTFTADGSALIVNLDAGASRVSACHYSSNPTVIVDNGSAIVRDVHNIDWGDPTGTYHATLYPCCKGDRVSDHVLLTRGKKRASSPTSPLSMWPTRCGIWLGSRCRLLAK